MIKTEALLLGGICAFFLLSAGKKKPQASLSASVRISPAAKAVPVQAPSAPVSAPVSPVEPDEEDIEDEEEEEAAPLTFNGGLRGEMEHTSRDTALAAFQNVLEEGGSIAEAKVYAENVFFLMGGEDASFLSNLRVKDLA